MYAGSLRVDCYAGCIEKHLIFPRISNFSSLPDQHISPPLLSANQALKQKMMNPKQMIQTGICSSTDSTADGWDFRIKYHKRQSIIISIMNECSHRQNSTTFKVISYHNLQKRFFQCLCSLFCYTD